VYIPEKEVRMVRHQQVVSQTFIVGYIAVVFFTNPQLVVRCFQLLHNFNVLNDLERALEKAALDFKNICVQMNTILRTLK
jgi:hypothetical protein